MGKKRSPQTILGQWHINCMARFFLSSETQGQSVGSGKKAGRKFSIQVRAEEPLGNDSHQTISENSSRYRLLIGHKKCFIVPNRQTVSPTFFSWVPRRQLLSCQSCPVHSPSLCIQRRLLFLTRNKGTTDELKKRFGYYQQEQYWICPENVLFLTDHNWDAAVMRQFEKSSESQYLGALSPVMKTFAPPFLPTRLTAPGSLRMGFSRICPHSRDVSLLRTHMRGT